jgi:hypothetical protein
MLLHWILNPGLLVNELIFGQRIPKVTLIDKTSTEALVYRQYIPCPSCGAINSARYWSKGNAMGHWLGLVCPQCGEKIPCLMNVFSIVVLVLLAPLYFLAKKFLEPQWLAWERQRFPNLASSDTAQAKKVSWIRMGTSYGVIMFVVMTFPKILRHELSANQVVMQVLVWLAAGAVFGTVMWWIMGRRKQR